VLPCGDAALLVELDTLDEVLALAAALRTDLPAGVEEIVPAARTVLLRCDPRLGQLARIADVVRRIPLQTSERAAVGEVEIPVRYDGADLADVAELTGLAAREIVERHSRSGWTVAFCGFAPGFGYLVADTDWPQVPRRGNPRTRVPAGSVALAAEFSGVYPRESPGGWQLIGRTDRAVFDLGRNPPALLRPGVRVRFVEVR
jgi:KipI family sensor histidine kinase inhibitor